MIGVDEVGRGCLAGPLLVVAAKTHKDLPAGLKDSKLLSRKQRAEILNLLSICCNFGEGWVSAAEIDRDGLALALKLGVKRALNKLNAEPAEEIIMDGKINYIPEKYKNAKCLVRADSLIPIVSAASIYAKVARDNYMFMIARRYPRYRFDRHVGYGTAAHIEALKSYGALKSIHRTSFAPVAELAL
jgi:ribonuclease HII